MRKAKVQKDKKQEVKGLYRRGKTYWVAYKTIDGSICRESTGEKTQVKAVSFLAKRREQVEDGEIKEARKQKNNKLGELAKEYLECCIGQKAYHSKKHLVNQLIKRFGNLKVRELDTHMIEKW